MRRPTIQLFLGHAASAVLLGLAFPLPGWWPLAWVALVPAGWGELEARNLKLENREGQAARRRVAGLLGRASPLLISWLIWAAWWFARTAWVRGVSVPGWFVIALVEGFCFAAAFAWFGWMVRKTRWPAAVLLPAAWVSVELVRVNFPFGGFGWFVLGHTQGAWRALTQVGTWSQVASLGGEHAVSWLLAMASGLAVDAMGLRATKLGRCAGSGVRWRWVATLAAVSVWLTLAWGWGLADRELHEARRLTVAAVQTDIVNDNSVALTHEDEQARWRALLELTVGLGQGRDTTATDSIRGLGVGASGSEGSGVDLIVWPESMVPGPVNEAVRAMGAADDPWGYWESRHYHRQLVELAERVGVPIVVGGNAYGGAVEVERDGAVGLLPTGRTNAAYVYAPGVGQVRGTGAEGGRVDRYDKQHLVVAGETIPGGEMWPWWRAWVVGWISPWGYDFTLDAGAGPVVFDVTAGRGAVRLATPICYEVASPAVVRDMVTGSEPWRVAPVGGTSKRVDLLTNLTNNGWYTGASMRRQMVQIATFRAIEHRVPVVMACNTGVSAVIDATGRVVAELPAGREGVLVAEVGLTEATTGYGVAGRWPWWALLWGMLAGSAGLAWQGRGKRRSEAPAPS